MLIFQLIIIQILTFLALVFVSRKIMYSASFMETKRLQRLSGENSQKARELAAKLEDAQRQYQEKVESAEKEVKRLKAQAGEEAQKLKEDILNKARQESERIVNQALNTKEKLKEEIESKMVERGIEQSLKLIHTVLSAQSQLSLHQGLVDNILEEIEKTEPEKLKINIHNGKLLTPYEISKPKKEKMLDILSQKSGKEISLEEEIDKNIIAGIAIKFGGLVIDGSLANKLREAAEALKRG
ncbi:MAG: F0F1 ATP synthase subunit delta [Candidatus Omnitrophota bacterium]